MSKLPEEGLREVILPRTGRGSFYVKALRAAMLELIDSHDSMSRNELEVTICIDWNIMGRSFDHHFNDLIQFGLIAGEEDGLRLTPRGKGYLKRALQDESVEQVRMKPKSVSEKQPKSEGN